MQLAQIRKALRNTIVLSAIVMTIGCEDNITQVIDDGGSPWDTTFSINPFGAFLDGGAYFSGGYGPFAGINLPNAVNGSFDVGFVAPPNFIAGTNFFVELIWNINETGCTIQFLPNSLSVARVDGSHIIGPFAESGLSIVGGTVLSAPAIAQQSTFVDVIIESPDGVTAIEPGDAISFSLWRAGTTPSDTCTQKMVIQGIEVSYE